MSQLLHFMALNLGSCCLELFLGSPLQNCRPLGFDTWTLILIDGYLSGIGNSIPKASWCGRINPLNCSIKHPMPLNVSIIKFISAETMPFFCGYLTKKKKIQNWNIFQLKRCHSFVEKIRQERNSISWFLRCYVLILNFQLYSKRSWKMQHWIAFGLSCFIFMILYWLGVLYWF